MDVGKLLTMLIRYVQGEKKVWSVIHPPSPQEEDQRQLHRELMALKRERTHHINRLEGLRNSLVREHQRYQLVQEQVHQIELVRLEAIRTANTPAIQQVRQLLRLSGIGLNSAWLYVLEFFSWRDFRNPRQLG